MLHFKNVSKIYPGQSVALKNINLDIAPGEFISIVGQSGTGKTTLVKLILAEERPSKGEITIGGWDITGIKYKEIPTLRRQIGVVFQDFKLLPRKTLFENVAFALQVAGETKDKIAEIAPQVLKIVGLEKNMHRFPNQISGGEQQRVVVARSLAHRPKILVADEPTGNLDSINSRDIIELLKKINDFGTTIILVTHNREIVNALRKRVVTLEDGVIISDRQRGKYLL
jgi:cell division transport system ATP-binding protein